MKKHFNLFHIFAILPLIALLAFFASSCVPPPEGVNWPRGAGAIR